MRVSIFISCVSDFIYPNVGKSVVHILERLGVGVDFPENQTCCGQPAYNSGYFKETESAAASMIHAFRNSEYIVCPSGSCTAMLRHFYPALFAGDDSMLTAARELAGRVYEFSEFMVGVLKNPDIGAVYPAKATYHHSCHMSRELGVKTEPLELLRQVRDLELVDLPYAHDCCGFGGTFSVKMSGISVEMVREKAHHIRSTDADVLVGSDMACLMNIGGYMRKNNQNIKTLHVAELLYEGMQPHENK